MKLKIIAAGLACIISAIPGYIEIPGLITNEINILTGGNALSLSRSALLQQMQIPSIDTITLISQYSFVGLAIAGIGIIIFGIVSRKYTPQFVVSKIESEDDDNPDESQGTSKAFKILQERLARGEISAKEFQNLKKFLEERKN